MIIDNAFLAITGLELTTPCPISDMRWVVVALNMPSKGPSIKDVGPFLEFFDPPSPHFGYYRNFDDPPLRKTS